MMKKYKPTNKKPSPSHHGEGALRAGGEDNAA